MDTYKHKTAYIIEHELLTTSDTKSNLSYKGEKKKTSEKTVLKSRRKKMIKN